MRKIKTIFERDWEGDHKVINQVIPGVFLEVSSEDLRLSKHVKATEKLDGMNVRATIRNGFCVRLEKRRNPDKNQKANGITEPWYKDVDDYGLEDRYLRDALCNTNIKELPDGEWSGEAIGPNIQGNPLNLDFNRIVFFSLGQAPVFEDVPTSYDELKEWLPKQKSKYGNDCGIEGIVWHCLDGQMFKIKTKDF